MPPLPPSHSYLCTSHFYPPSSTSLPLPLSFPPLPLHCSLQRGYTECIQTLETYGLKRLPSNISIASQFQVPSSGPSTVDEYGHVPLHRPGGASLLTTSQLFDRGTADGNDRESRPSSALDHTAGSPGQGAGSSQQGVSRAIVSLWCAVYTAWVFSHTRCPSLVALAAGPSEATGCSESVSDIGPASVGSPQTPDAEVGCG